MPAHTHIYGFHLPNNLPAQIKKEVLDAIAAGKITTVREEVTGTDYVSGIELERFYGGVPPVAGFKF